jgi:8-oxo-dGTP diphosphatase
MKLDDIKLFVATKALIFYNGKVLLVRESPKYKEGTQIGKFDVVGGRITSGEHFEESLKRETMEETKIGKPFFVNESRPVVKGEKWQVVRIFFEAFAENDKVVLGEDHEKYEWIDPKEYRKYDVIANLHPVFDAYLEMQTDK